MADDPALTVEAERASEHEAEPGLLAVVATLLLPLVHSSELFHSFWAPKAAVCLVLAGPGLVALTRLALAGSVPARLAALFVAAAALSTAVSAAPVLAVTGAPNWGTGLVFVAVVVGAWALGATAGPRRRRQLAGALVAAAVLNAVVAWLQARGLVPVSLESPGRSSGLMGNPVHLGALVAGALWIVAERISLARRAVPWFGAAVLLAGAAQLSGGRSGVGLAALVVAAGVRRLGWRRSTVVAAAVAVGFLAASAGAGDGVTTGSARALTQSTRQVDVRGGLWRIGAEAALERPVLGWGPGRFLEATSPRYTPVVTENGVSLASDAHNWVVEYAVTTGAVGLLLLGGWLVTAGRASGGPLAGFAALIGLFTLVEPQSVSLTPLALLALGAASRGTEARERGALGWRAVAAAGGLAGALAAGVLLAGEVTLRQASLDTSPERYEAASALLPPWPEVSMRGSWIGAFHALSSEPHRRQALALARQATERDPADPAAWAALARLELRWGTPGGTAWAVERALERNPWAAEALLIRAVLGQREGDAEVRAESCRRLARLGRTPPVCGGPATVRS